MSNKFFTKIIELRWWVLVLFGFIAIFGSYSLSQIKIDAIPDITNKQVIVNTKTFGMDPTKVEKSVTYPIEAELYGIAGLSEMRSISKFGLSQIVLIFRDETDIHFARNQVLQRISALGNQLPNNLRPTIAPLTTGIGEIIIYRVFSPSSPCLGGASSCEAERSRTMGVQSSPCLGGASSCDSTVTGVHNPSSVDDLMELRTIQEFQIARELKKISGVAEIDTIGGFERQLHLNVNSQKITKYGMSPERLVAQIQTLGENFGGGYIEQNDEQKIVRTFANINSLEDIMNLPIKIDYTGKALPLSHVVEVRQEYSQRLGAATYQGKEAVLGVVMLQSGSNAREVLTKVKETIAKLNKKGSAVQIEILYDRQFLIDSTVKTVAKNLAEGILLVVGVLCLLLGNVKIGLIVASSLLFCIFILAICMAHFGISANLMSLGAIDFGLLVDSSVVLMEFIASNLLIWRSKEEKADLVAKFSAQTAKPVFIGIAIIILVYLPILMFSGIEGKTFKPMAINVIIALLASLFTTFLLMPVLAYFFVKQTAHEKRHRFFSSIQDGYERLLDKALANVRLAIFCCAGFFISSLSLLFFMPSDFLPDLNEGDLVFEVVIKNGSSLSKTVEIVKNLGAKISIEKEVDKTFSRLGTSQTGLDPMPQNSADFFVILKQEFKSDAKKISEKIARKMGNLCSECKITAMQPIKMRFNEILEGSRADLSLKIFGEDLSVLMKITQKIQQLLEKNPAVKSAEKDFINSIRKGAFVNIIPNYAQIAKHQVSIADVNNNISTVMAGIEVGNFYSTEFPIAIMLHLDETDRNELNLIKNIPIGVSDGGSFPISKVVEVEESEDITSIPRLFGKRYSSLSIYLKNTDYGNFIAAAEKEIIKNNLLPSGYQLEWGGRFEHLNSAKRQIFFIIPLILLLIFALLYKIFGSLKKVLVVFSSVPFALSGAILLLFICQIPITISVYVGFIALIGISLLNSIILINSLNSTSDLKLVCTSRLRPILMTALVASLGFLPMAFGHGIGAEVQQPIAITVIGGIVSSTIATLVLIPVLIKKFQPNKTKC